MTMNMFFSRFWISSTFLAIEAIQPWIWAPGTHCSWITQGSMEGNFAAHFYTELPPKIDPRPFNLDSKDIWYPLWCFSDSIWFVFKISFEISRRRTARKTPYVLDLTFHNNNSKLSRHWLTHVIIHKCLQSIKGFGEKNPNQPNSNKT